MHRQLAGRLTGRVTKWVVVVAALLITGVMSTFSAQLVDVQNNEASSWLPGEVASLYLVSLPRAQLRHRGLERHPARRR